MIKNGMSKVIASIKLFDVTMSLSFLFVFFFSCFNKTLFTKTNGGPDGYMSCSLPPSALEGQRAFFLSLIF